MSSGTIYALATGAGRSAIAVLRISGPEAGATARAFTGKTLEPRQARFTTFVDPASGDVLDTGLLLWFPAPHSATGEDYAEFHIHGGRAVIEAFFRALRQRPGLRDAMPGEFARRGFENGKLDLSQVEALADLIDAQTEFQRRQAQRIAGGELRRRIEGWRATLVNALAQIEAELDFSDEDDVASATLGGIEQLLQPVIGDMRGVLRTAPASERLRDGFTVLILGRPNAGKSTLMNALARRDVAIVSDIPGTTRDMIEVHLDVDGMPVTFIDSAGLREATDQIEKIGIDRTIERARDADLLLWLSEDGVGPTDELGRFGLEAADILLLITKTDIRGAPGDVLSVSARTGDGIARLLQDIGERAKAHLGDGASALLARQRHREAVTQALADLENIYISGKSLEIIAEDLRAALRALGRIVGAVDVEQILDVIFSRFCIGK